MMNVFHVCLVLVLYGVAVYGYEFICPDRSHLRIYSKAACTNPEYFTCLKDALVDTYNKSCYVSRPLGVGYKYVYRPGYDREKCVQSRYQPFIFYRNQQTDCFYIKSSCNEEGQIMYSPGSTTSDVQCKCDEKNGFTFVMEPRNKVFCIPSEEDCSCFRKLRTIVDPYNSSRPNQTKVFPMVSRIKDVKETEFSYKTIVVILVAVVILIIMGLALCIVWVQLIDDDKGFIFEGEKIYKVYVITNNSNSTDQPTETNKPVHVPEAPKDLKITRFDKGSVDLVWKQPDNGSGYPIQGYVIEKKPKEGDWVSVNNTPVQGLKYNVSGLEEGQVLEFRVSAVNKEGTGKPSSPTQVHTVKDPVYALDAPKDLEIEKYDKRSVDLVWKKPDNDGGDPIHGYFIQMKPKERDWVSINNHPVQELKYSVVGLKEGQVLEFRVLAVNKEGPGTPSSPTQLHMVKDPVYVAGAPGQPQMDNMTSNSVELSWTKPSKDGGGQILRYVIEKKKKGGDWERATEVPANSTHYKVNDLIEGEEYQFRVRAINEAGPGEPSQPTQPIIAEYQPEPNENSSDFEPTGERKNPAKQKDDKEQKEPDTIERWIGKDRCQPKILNTQLTDRILLTFSRSLKIEHLKIIGFSLGLSDTDVENIQYNHDKAPDAARLELLCKWRNKTGPSATVETLLNELMSCHQESDSIRIQSVQAALDNLNK